MIYTESFPAFRSITEENLKKYEIDLDVEFQPSKDPPGGATTALSLKPVYL